MEETFKEVSKEEFWTDIAARKSFKFTVTSPGEKADCIGHLGKTKIIIKKE